MNVRRWTWIAMRPSRAGHACNEANDITLRLRRLRLLHPARCIAACWARPRKQNRTFGLPAGVFRPGDFFAPHAAYFGARRAYAISPPRHGVSFMARTMLTLFSVLACSRISLLFKAIGVVRR
jgi:hypothetical protein